MVIRKLRRKYIDFPFYNDNPKISNIDIFILLIVPILFTIYTFLPYRLPWGITPFVFCGLHLLAFLYVARGKLSLLVRNPNFRDYVRIIVTLILQYIFTIGLSLFLSHKYQIAFNGNGIFESDMGLMFWIKIIIQLFGEELYKILIFLGMLTIMFKTTKRRKLSIFVALIVSLTFFSFLHMTTYNNILQILLLQGVATIFCFYNYLKSKNIMTSYIHHLLYDAIPFILAIMHII